VPEVWLEIEDVSFDFLLAVAVVAAAKSVTSFLRLATNCLDGEEKNYFQSEDDTEAALVELHHSCLCQSLFKCFFWKIRLKNLIVCKVFFFFA
jgi:hypothetical protein